MTAALVPPRVRRGDRVALLSVSAPLIADRLAFGLERLREWGLEVDLLPTASATHPQLDYLAGTDEQRAADLTAALTGDYAAVLFGRGGYGAPRMLDLVDWEAAAAAGPRWVVGFSDVTAVQTVVRARLGWQSLYAAMPATWYFTQEPARESLRRRLFGPLPERLTFPEPDTLVPGTAHAPLAGGCLSLLAGAVGTPFEHRPAGHLLFLEDVDEEPLRLDRMLTQLRGSGYLDEVAGVLLGTFHGCGDPAMVRSVLVDRLGDLGVPVLAGADIGHGVALQALPLGAPAVLDADAGTLHVTG